ncbi:ABC transporter substrate-binding protein [Sinomonas sp.]|uniref:ABC transporter substrate-binding protein n=1 Tax=Sinomonas sp. TaxID=1914986 RepID=UPI003F80E19A
MLALTGCGGNDFAGSSQTGSTSGSALSSLPAQAQKAYINSDALTGQPPYLDGWKPKGPPPWTIGYSSPYAGNSWQTTAMDYLMKQVLPRYQKAGLIKNIVVAQSGGDDTVQNQQIRQLADQGVDIIIACCSAKTALNLSIQYAYNTGVPFVAWSGHVDSPYAVSAVTNYREAGSVFAKEVFDKIGGKGNVLDVQGVPGATNAIDFETGVQDALKQYPGIKLVGSVNGMWSASVTKTEVQKFLATHPEKLDGIVAQPASATGALQALEQSGRPVVPINIGGETGAACYWVNHPDFATTGYNIWPPKGETDLGVETAVRILEQQGPKIQSIVLSVSPITYDEAKKALGTDCDPNADGWLEPTGGWLTGKQLDAFFQHPSDPLTWKQQ